MQRFEFPHHTEYEKGALALCMADAKLLDYIVGKLKESDFFHAKHRYIFEAILSIYLHEDPVNEFTVCDRLAECNLLPMVGGRSYVSDLIDYALPIQSNAEFYVEQIHDAARHREIIERLTLLLEKVCEDNIGAQEARDFVREELKKMEE